MGAQLQSIDGTPRSMDGLKCQTVYYERGERKDVSIAKFLVQGDDRHAISVYLRTDSCDIIDQCFVHFGAVLLEYIGYTGSGGIDANNLTVQCAFGRRDEEEEVVLYNGLSG